MTTPASAPSFRPRPELLLMLALVFVALFADAVVAFRGDRRPIAKETMIAARAKIIAERQPGNLVVHSPLFSIAELSGLGDLDARPDLPPLDVRKSRRILVLDIDAAPMWGFGQEEKRFDIGEGVVLRTFLPSSEQPVTLFDLVGDVDRLEMRVERPRGNVSSRCTGPRSEGGRSCPGEADWLYVARRALTVEGKNVQCIWAHPTTGGDIILTLPPMPEPAAGRRLSLELYSGLNDDAVRQTPDGASVRTDVEQDGKIKGGVTLVNRIGWAKTEVAIDPGKQTDLRVSTPQDGRRHHCLMGRVIEEVKR
ncbi:MAG: hypothetical protein U1E65_36155 [Myxococcota bacterium]